jgi:1-acyl-sn-glycerol-3-phosphate acyltransferase
MQRCPHVSGFCLEEADTLFWWVAKLILGPMMKLLWRPKAEGVHHVPRKGAAILAGNHLSFADHFFGPLPLRRRRVVFLAKAEYFTGRGIKGMLSRAFFTGVGQVPIDRSGGKASEAALNTGLRVLGEGHLLGIYPEGTRSPDGRLYRGKTGVARLALEARVPVIPMAMIGTFEMMPPGQHYPRLGAPVGVKFGKPLDFSRYYGMEHDRMVLRAVTDEIIEALRELSGQEYVDKYATRAKAEQERGESGGDGGDDAGTGGGPGGDDPSGEGAGQADGTSEAEAGDEPAEGAGEERAGKPGDASAKDTAPAEKPATKSTKKAEESVGTDT